MAYVALYRKWRPATFQDLVGQDHISKTLGTAISSGRIGHAYLFSGPRGTGKTSTAKIFARSLNCEHGPTVMPCGVCESCKKIADGSALEVFEIDAASNRGIEEIRTLRETVKFAPAAGRYKVYIIDEVHMLTTEAFNALLKTLEEPPAHVVFILATTEAHKVPATIQSRCQRFDFHRITAEDIEARLAYVVKESDLEAEEEALKLIALQADGGMRDALSLLDQCLSLTEGKIETARVQELLGLIGHTWIFEMTEKLHAGEVQAVWQLLAKLLYEGKELRQLLSELSLHFRSLLIYRETGSLGALDLYAEPEDILKEQAQFFAKERLMAMMKRLQEAQQELRWSPQPRIAVEVALLELAKVVEECPQDAPPVHRTAPEDGRVARLEAQMQALLRQMSQVPTTPPAAQSTEAPRTMEQATPKKIEQKPSTPLQKSVKEMELPAGRERDGAVWSKALAYIQQMPNGIMIMAGIKHGIYEGVDGTRVFLRFASGIMADLANRNYRAAVEEAIASVLGRPMEAVILSDEEGKALAPNPVEKKGKNAKKEVPELPKPKELSISTVPEKHRTAVENAQKFLGGVLVEDPPK